MCKHVHRNRSPRTPQPTSTSIPKTTDKALAPPGLGHMPSIRAHAPAAASKIKARKQNSFPQFSRLAAEFSRQTAAPLASPIIECGCEGGRPRPRPAVKTPAGPNRVDAAGRCPLAWRACTVPYLCPPGSSRFPAAAAAPPPTQSASALKIHTRGGNGRCASF